MSGKNMKPTPFVIRLTPRGRAAVASLMIVGHDVMAVLEPCLVLPKAGRSRRDRCDDNTPVFAYFSLANAREEVVLHFHSRDMIELHCHGGDAVVRAIEAALVERGAVSQTWQDWLLETQELDIIQREALQLLPFAETELTAKLLLAQYHGALSRRIQQVHDLLDTSSPDALDILDSLLASYQSGKHLTTPFRVGLIGEVNVGKSSLMNALVGFNRSITSEVAGTTRDTVSAKTVIAGWPVLLIDTAGIRETSNPIEQEGIARMQAVVADSDLLLLITDACDQSTSHLPQTMAFPESTPMIHIVNKIDIVEGQSIDKHSPDTVAVSAITGAGLEQLNKAIIGKLHKSNALANDETCPSQVALVFTERQYEQLLSVRESLEKTFRES
jgi:tRNA modification GTPase